MEQLYDLARAFADMPLATLAAVVALAAIGLAAFAIHAVQSVARGHSDPPREPPLRTGARWLRRRRL